MMAALRQTPENGRPPDASPTSSTTKILPKKKSSCQSNHLSSDSKSTFDNGNFYKQENNFNEDINKNVKTVNKQEKNGLKQSFPKLLCLNKSPKRNSTMKTLNVNSLRTDYFEYEQYLRKSASSFSNDSPNCDKSKTNRNSFHQNVEEALNSLLWQPYEYRDGTARHSPCSSTLSSCDSRYSSYNDLDESTKTDDGTSSSCIFQDLHPLQQSSTSSPSSVPEEMVINLRRSHQSRTSYPSRDEHNNTNRLDFDDYYAFSSTETTNRLPSRKHANNNNSDGHFCCDMPVSAPLTSSNNNYNDNNVTQTTSSEDDGVIRNLSAVNVVGLPNHARYSSVPVSNNRTANNTNNANNLIPKHYRNTSEPFTCQTNHNLQINTTRSISVPKTTFNNNSRFSQKINTSNELSNNVNVNFYRAVPVNVISSVPTIHCLNTLSNVQGNEVSNVQVLPLGNPPCNSSVVVGTTQVILHNTQDRNNTFYSPTSSNQVIIQNNKTTVPLVNVNSSNQVIKTNVQVESSTSTRTFTSTEAQTDEISILTQSNDDTNTVREHRRRERRERRQQRRLNNNSNNNRCSVDSGTQVDNRNERLPDLLNSHLPPPYSSVSGNAMSPLMANNSGLLQHLPAVVPGNIVPPSGFVFQGPPPPVGQVPLVQGAPQVAVQPPTGFRFPFPATGFRRGRFSEDPPKGCCGFLSWKPGSLRWFIALIALVAVCCVLVGTALGAMRPSGRDHLTVSLLMIGVGIVLVTVSGVAWRLTSHDSSTCRSMLGLGSTESVEVCARRFVPRLPPAYGRPHHPYAAMMYPEFQYRPPPPSYQASMQEYRLRLLLLERGSTPQIHSGIQNAISPPPTYRSQSGSLLRAPGCHRRDAQSEYSCPPSYRSQSTRPGTLQSNSVLHSREQSLALSESNHGGSLVNVVNILGSTEEDIALDNITLDSLKMEPENDLNTVKMLLKSSSGDLVEGSKDGNLVTIVQTSDMSPVIVTVSGSRDIDVDGNNLQSADVPTGLEILAHL